MTILINPFILGVAGCPPCPPAVQFGGWVEVGRSTLACAGDTLSVSCLPYHKEYMVIGKVIDCGNVSVRGRFNGDSGCNYVTRTSRCDCPDVTFTSCCVFFLNSTAGRTGNEMFQYTVSNIGACKLGIGHLTSQECDGVGVAPEREEYVFKWACTTPINQICTVNTIACTNYGVGSEMIILGSCNPCKTINFWSLLTTATAMCCPVCLTTCTFTPKKYLYTQLYMVQSTTATYHIRVGNTTIDAGCNYAYRHGRCGGNGSNVAQCFLLLDASAAAENLHGCFYISNVASDDKLFIGHANHIVTFGAATPPLRTEYAYKWGNTCDQIDVIGLVRTAGTGVLTEGYIKVWGHD